MTGSGLPRTAAGQHICWAVGGNSRLYTRIRQKDGLSYGIGTQLRVSSFEPNSAIVMYAIFAPENLGRLRAGVQEELDRALSRWLHCRRKSPTASTRVLQQRTPLRAARMAVSPARWSTRLYLGRTFAYSGEIDRRSRR